MRKLPMRTTYSLPWRWLVLTSLSLSYMLVFMQRTGPGVISNSIQAEFHVSAAVLGTITSIQYLLYMVMQIPVGVFGDKWGPERTLIIGVFLDGAGTLLFSSAHTFGWLLAGRAVVGLGDSLIWVNIVLILAKWFGRGRFAAILAVVNTFGNLGAIITTLPLAAWIAAAGWHVPFFILGSLLVIVSALDIFVFRGRSRGLNTAANDAGVDNAGVDDSGTSVIVHRMPLRHMFVEILRDRLSWSTFFCHFGAMGTYLAMVSLWIIPYFMAVYGLSRSNAAWFSLIGFVGSLIASPVIGGLSDKLQNRKGPYIFTQAFGFVAWLLVIFWGGQPPLLLSGVIMFIVGFGSGSSLLTFAVIRDLAQPSQSGLTSGFANTGGFLSAVVLPVVFGALFDSAGGALGSGHDIIRHAYGVAFILPAAFSALGVLGSLLLPTSSSAHKPEERVA